MTKKQIQFLLALAALLDEHQAELGYTNKDDGIHVTFKNTGDDFLIGWGSVNEIRDRLKQQKP